jgi:nucleoside-diphosphate-sugar epimerase
VKYVIIGCGWLGLPLAVELLRKGHEVAGSVRSEEKLRELKNKGVDAFLYDGFEIESVPVRFRNADVLIVNFPPSKSVDYAIQIHSLLKQFSQNTSVVFTSSTGVYAGFGSIDEESPVLEEHPVRRAETEVENSGLNYTILRLAGLIGGERHPVKYLSGKVSDNGQQCVNLVHREDVIRAIERVISAKATGKIFNICFPNHPSRLEYYTAKAIEFGIDPPLFETSETEGKRVDGKLFSREHCFDYLTSI